MATQPTTTKTTKIAACTCKHEHQDNIHGKGMRVFNKAKSGKPGTARWRCSVCGAEFES